MALNIENPRSFNLSLRKSIFTEFSGLKVAVEMVNSYKFPDCHVRIFSSEEIPNELRLMAYDVRNPSRQGLHDERNVLHGNIQKYTITASVNDWSNVFDVIDDLKEGEEQKKTVKMKKILSLLAIVVVLVGCSKEKIQLTTCDYVYDKHFQGNTYWLHMVKDTVPRTGGSLPGNFYTIEVAQSVYDTMLVFGQTYPVKYCY